MGIFDLSNKRAVVFGGAGYLGAATVRALLELGAKVIVADMFPPYAKENAAGLEGENCRLVPCDLRDAAAIRGAFDACVAAFGGCNVMINLATFGAANALERMTDEEWAAGIEGTLNCSFRALRESIPYLEKSGNGCIVNTGSMYGVVSPDYRIYGESGQNNPPNYGAAKAGVIMLTKYAAAHLAPKHIRVNSVTPGPFPDDRKLPPEEFLNKLSEKTMLGRVGKASEIAGAFCYLVSDAASFTTGANLVVDGGWTAW